MRRSMKSWLGFTRDVGLDLGTGNTLLHVRGQGVVLNEPSVVAVERATGTVRAIGWEAKRMLGRTASDVEAIRPLRDGVIADINVAEQMIRHFLRVGTSGRVLATKPRVVVGIPSGITDLEHRAVRQAAFSAGAREVYLLAEPVAAAIGAGLPVDAPVGNMVIDIGGGTTEIAVISLNGIVADASIRVGGDRMDHAIISYVRRNFNVLIGESTAEQVKQELASAWEPNPDRRVEVKGRDQVSGIPRTVALSSVDVAEAIEEPIQNIVGAVLRALEATPPELASDIIERGIVMTGGGALITGLDTRIAHQTGLPVTIDEDPLTSVVRGTAAVLDALDRYQGVLAA